jgi:TPR repeat protein
MGVIYSDGIGIEQDVKEAAKWLRKSAPKGIADAQFRLGLMYKEGRGVEQNFKEAEKWLGLAAGQGIEKAQYELAVLMLRKAMIDRAKSATATEGDHR